MSKKVKLNKPFRGGTRKFRVFVKNQKGNIVKVDFGDPNMEIRRDDPDRRKSFRARHKCDQKKDKTTPGYWSCYMWSKKSVSDILKEEGNKMKDDKHNVEDYPVVDPSDDSSGMDLHPKNPEKRKKETTKLVSFKDYMKQQNTTEFKNHNIEESYPKGSSWSSGVGNKTGASLAKKSSYKQPGQGKQTIGSEFSQSSAYETDPYAEMDANLEIDKLPDEVFNSLKKHSKKLGTDVKSLVKMAHSKSMSMEDFIQALDNM